MIYVSEEYMLRSLGVVFWVYFGTPTWEAFLFLLCEILEERSLSVATNIQQIDTVVFAAVPVHERCLPC
jgi:hypothetical protein